MPTNYPGVTPADNGLRSSEGIKPVDERLRVQCTQEKAHVPVGTDEDRTMTEKPRSAVKQAVRIENQLLGTSHIPLRAADL